MVTSDIALVTGDGLPGGRVARDALQPEHIYHCVLLLIVTPQRQVVLAEHDGRLSATATTLCRYNEPSQAAAERLLVNAAPGRGVKLYHLGDQFYVPVTGRRAYTSAYYGLATLGDQASGCRLMTAEQITAAASRCTLIFRFAWQSYQSVLPV